MSVLPPEVIVKFFGILLPEAILMMCMATLGSVNCDAAQGHVDVCGHYCFQKPEVHDLYCPQAVMAKE